MGMIYFDGNKKAHAHPINDCVATVDEATWDFYSGKTCSVDWDIINGAFVPLKTQEQLQIEQQKEKKRWARNRAFGEVDWRAWRNIDQETMQLSPDDDWKKIADYRRYLRDFTRLENWWTLPIPTYEQFLKENP
jgi:hypothetical protein